MEKRDAWPEENMGSIIAKFFSNDISDILNATLCLNRSYYNEFEVAFCWIKPQIIQRSLKLFGRGFVANVSAERKPELSSSLNELFLGIFQFFATDF